MACIDRYILRACMVGTVFVALSLVAIIFLSQSLRFLELVLEAGAPTIILWQLTLLALPRFFEAVLPISVMAACIFVYNRLSQDSELAVIQASGIAPIRIARPAILLAAGCVVLMLVMTAWAAPMANAKMKQIREQLKSEYSTMLLREGVFHKFDNNITIYVDKRRDNGQLEGIVIHDARKSAGPQRTIVARTGQLERAADGSQSILIQDGNRQSYSKKNNTLSQLSFQRYTLDLPEPRDDSGGYERDADERTLSELITVSSDSVEGEADKAQQRALSVEVHRRLVSPFTALSFTLIGLCPFLLGSLARRGYSKRIVLAAGAVVLIQGLYLGAFNMARDVDSVYYLITIMAMYFIVFAPMIAVSALLLWRSDMLPHLRRHAIRGAA